MILHGAAPLAIVLAAALSPRPDSLEPEVGVFTEEGFVTDYQSKVAKVLLPAPRRHVQMVRQPSSGLPEAVYLESVGAEGETSCRVVSNRFRAGMSSSLLSQPGPLGDEVRDQMAAPLSMAICQQLEAVWMSALTMVTPFLLPELRMRGDRYHFGTLDRSFGYRAGMCFKPEKGSKMEALARLGNQLAAFARSPAEERAKLESMLAVDAKHLLLRFKQQ